VDIYVIRSKNGPDVQKKRTLGAQVKRLAPSRKGICFICAAFCDASEKQKQDHGKEFFPMQLKKQPDFELGQIVATEGNFAADITQTLRGGRPFSSLHHFNRTEKVARPRGRF
jgi:hypothetical protein